MKKEKKQESVAEAPQKPHEPPTRWDETFEDSDHTHFIRMSAEAMQEAMNIAATDRDVEKMLQVAGHWGTLAATLRDLNRSRLPIGFNKEDTDG